MNWFEVDKEGLRKQLERKGKAFAAFELLQNAWDTEAQNVSVDLQFSGTRGRCRLVVEDDDPQGFNNLSHAFTLFAESSKKGLPNKRGRFNLGEKLVLALCERATVESTTGTLYFTDKGREQSKIARHRGTRFDGIVRMTQPEMAEVLAEIEKVLPPQGVNTTLNGRKLQYRPAVHEFAVSLPTEVSDEEGNLRRTRRLTTVSLHPVQPWNGEVASIYEMGIPVVETGDQWHVNIHQKVPLSMERDNVTPAYLRELRVAVLNHMSEQIKGEEASSNWVREASSHDNVSAQALARVLDERFGTKRVSFDPKDQEANKRAASEGYTVISGGSLSAEEWKNAKAHNLIVPAGQVTPTPKPFSPEGEPLKLIPDDYWSEGMCRIANFTRYLAQHILGINLKVQLANDHGWPFRASFGGGVLIFNVASLGRPWFEKHTTDPEVLALIIHEFGHHYASDHLSKEYHDALCRVGARMVTLSTHFNSEWFQRP